MQIRTKIEVIRSSVYNIEKGQDEIDFSLIGVESESDDEDNNNPISAEKVEYLFVDGILETKNFDYATKSLDYEDKEGIVTLWRLTETGQIPLNIKYNIEKLNKNEVFTN